MESPKIISNYHWYPILSAYELTEKQLADLDISDPDDVFVVVYHGQPMFINDFSLTTFPSGPTWMQEWDGYKPDSFFSGILVRFNDYYEMVQVATYIT